jgi:hypothetical protein
MNCRGIEMTDTNALLTFGEKEHSLRCVRIERLSTFLLLLLFTNKKNKNQFLSPLNKEFGIHTSLLKKVLK